MLTSWSEVSTPAELSMKSVLMQAAGQRVLDPGLLGEPEVAALADHPGAQLGRRRSLTPSLARSPTSASLRLLAFT